MKMYKFCLDTDNHKIISTITFQTFDQPELWIGEQCPRPKPSRVVKTQLKRPLSSVIDRRLFRFAGLVSLLPARVRNTAELVGSRWKQACHNQRATHTHGVCVRMTNGPGAAGLTVGHDQPAGSRR